MNRPNETNLRAVLAQIEAHPETWNQAIWHCGSSHCFMGWAQILAGREAIGETIRKDARVFLGLNAWEFDRLACASNTLRDIRTLVGTFSRADHDRASYNRAGYDSAGFDRAGIDRDGFDADNNLVNP